MATLNAVTVQMVDLYQGEDQVVNYTPDASLDVSTLPESAWTVELRLAQGRTALGNASPPAALVAAMTWDGTSLFHCTLTKDQTLALAAGPWTMDLWRTNAGAARLLVRGATTVYPAIQPTTTT